MSPSFVIYDENTFQENIKSTYENSLSSEVGHIILLRLLCYSWSERCKWNFLGKFNSTMKIQIEFENTEDLARMTEWEKRKHSTFLRPNSCEPWWTDRTSTVVVWVVQRLRQDWTVLTARAGPCGRHGAHFNTNYKYSK